jgi:hypothetical protein
MKLLLKLTTALLLLAIARPAAAYVFFTPDALLASFFPSADHVDAVVFTPDAAARGAFKARVGYDLPKPSYTIQVGHAGAATLGYAIVDDQLGQHEPITFGVLVGPDGKVGRIEVLVYREAYGDGVRSPAFRKQFTGLTAASPMRAGKEIQIVSGATSSSRALSVGVRRATAIVETWLASAPPAAAAVAPPSSPGAP